MRRTLPVISVAVVFYFSGGMVYGLLADPPWPMFGQNLRHTGLSPYAGPSRPYLAWSFQTSGGIWSSPAIGFEGKVYFASTDSCIYAVNSDGSLDWKYITNGGTTGPGGPAIGSDSNLYMGSLDNNIYSINSDGSLDWSYKTDDRVQSSPALGSGSETVYIGSCDNNLYCIGLDGGLDWSYRTREWVLSSPAVGSDGEVYVGSFDGNLYRIDPNGALDWSYQGGGEIWSPPSIGSDGKIYIGPHSFYSINSNGSLDWSYKGVGGIISYPAIDSAGKMYISTQSNYLYTINSDGSFSWSYRIDADVAAPSPAIGSDGRVYIGSDDNNFYSINSNGSLDWSYKTGAFITSSAALGSGTETVYVGSVDHNLYCFAQGPALGIETQPTATPTPPAEIVLNGTSFSAGEQLVATFKENEPIEAMYDVYAVFIIPGNRMLNAITLDVPLKPVATNVKGLPAGFSYELLSTTVPPAAPKGEYEIVVAFFDPGRPIHGRQDAFLDVNANFIIQ